MTNSRKQFQCLNGSVDLNSFNKLVADNNMEPEKSVFVFPSNLSHHAEDSALYSVKSGSGLAAAAHQLGANGVPTLGLPTTGIDIVSDASNIPMVAKQAVADLWRAVGFGMNIVLPTRPHSNQQYFDAALPGNVEPSFWGGIEASPNKHLADFYLAQLKKLKDFLDSANQSIDLHSNVDSMYALAFEEGKKAKKKSMPSEWFRTAAQQKIATVAPVAAGASASATATQGQSSASTIVPMESGATGSSKVSNLISDENIAKIIAALGSDWKFKNGSAPDTIRFYKENALNNFTVHKDNKFTTTDSDVETFKAILKGFQAVYGGADKCLPCVSAPRDLVDKWKIALKAEGYPEDKFQKIFKLPVPQPSPAPSSNDTPPPGPPPPPPAPPPPVSRR